jgi:hypothetical protein
MFLLNFLQQILLLYMPLAELLTVMTPVFYWGAVLLVFVCLIAVTCGMEYLYFRFVVMAAFLVLKHYAKSSTPFLSKLFKTLASLCIGILSWLSLLLALLFPPRQTILATDESSLELRAQQGFLNTIVPRASPRSS